MHIYVYRERERERERGSTGTQGLVCGAQLLETGIQPFFALLFKIGSHIYVPASRTIILLFTLPV
jgi:hypothetical protein